jgi:hypothetical protein
MQFDPEDLHILRARGGPCGGYDWPVNEHGVAGDYQDSARLAWPANISVYEPTNEVFMLTDMSTTAL